MRIHHLSVFALLLMACRPSPAVKTDSVVSDLVPVQFGVDGLAYVVNDVALIAPWDGPVPNEIELVQAFSPYAESEELLEAIAHGEDHTAFGVIAKAPLAFDDLDERTRRMWEIPIFGFDGAKTCEAKLTHRLSLYYRVPLDAHDSNDVMKSVRKSKPWVAVAFESECRGLLIDRPVNPVDQEPVENKAIETLIGVGEFEREGGFVERSVASIRLNANEFLVSVTEDGSGCIPGTTQELLVVRQSDQTWSKESYAKFKTGLDSEWQFAGRVGDALLAVSGTGVLVGETYIEFFPAMAPTFDTPECDENASEPNGY